MSLKAVLGPELPFLRRYARALTGSQIAGDAAVRETLEAILDMPGSFDTEQPARNELYRVFHKLWTGGNAQSRQGGIIAGLPSHSRQSLLLSAIEGFSIPEIAGILACPVEQVSREIAAANLAITDSLHARVMIIEDESIIALHIKSIVEDLGHSITGIARTRTQAFDLAAAAPPDLVLADISLADGSSGIDAARDILAMMNVPVIFITAFPERLLTGERPEPTYLITKPFEPATVTATIGQALLVQHECRTDRPDSAQGATDNDAPNPRGTFDSPQQLLADASLGDTEKQALLADWDADLDGRLNAESEGMSISDPITHRKEARLAEEAGHVKTALAEIAEKNADS